MDDNQTLRSMVRDDAYRVVRVLSDGPSGRTELVTLDGEGPLVRKHIPTAIANASAWAAAMESDEPLLPRIESLYRMPDELVVVYEYVPGDSLLKLVEEYGPLSTKRAADVIQDVCKAVAALHERGVVHRDITPGNVIVAADGAHLVDLGIARQRVEGKRRDTTTLGTWGFAAPEQYGFTQTDARSDIYSLGKLLGFALTGVQPESEQYEQKLHDANVVPADLAHVVEQATAFEPSARYQSAADLALAVKAAQPGTMSTEQPSATPVAPAIKQEPSQSAREVAPDADKPVSSRNPLEIFVAAPLHLRLVALLAWGFAFFFGLVDISAIVGSITKQDPPWGTVQRLMALVLLAGTLALTREAWCMVAGTDAYADNKRPMLSFLCKACIIIALVCIIIIMLSWIYAAIDIIF